MNSRGAVELVIAEVARQNGLIPIEIYSIIIAMALVTTFIFPFVLEKKLRDNPKIMD
jgi:Kef-type K+ transport system membrane component KefB